MTVSDEFVQVDEVAAYVGVTTNAVYKRERQGRLSGPALLPQTLQRIATVAAATETPLIASGGISSAEAVQQCLNAGASAVQLGVALLADPWLGERIFDTLGYQPSEV